jgi:hypothetical protein
MGMVVRNPTEPDKHESAEPFTRGRKKALAAIFCNQRRFYWSLNQAVDMATARHPLDENRNGSRPGDAAREQHNRASHNWCWAESVG